MGTSESIGRRIRRLRKARGWKQDDLAERAGVSRPQLSKIENDEVPNSRSATHASIAGALGVTLEVLLTGEGEDGGAGDDHQIDSQSARASEKKAGRSLADHFEIVDFYEGMIEVPITAEVACGLPMDYSVEGETMLVPKDFAPDPAKGEFMLRARGDSMLEFDIPDGTPVVCEYRPGKFPAHLEIIIAWYEPIDGSQPGGITMKRWIRKGGRKILQAGNPESPSYELKEGDIFELKGIVRRAWRIIDFPKISG